MLPMSQRLPCLRQKATAVALMLAVPVSAYLALQSDSETGAPTNAALAVTLPSPPSPMPRASVSEPQREGSSDRAPSREDPGSRQHLLDELLYRSRLQANWLESHGFTPGSPALERLHSLLDGKAALSATSAHPVAFGPQGGKSAKRAGDVPVLSLHERYVEANIPPSLLAGDSFLLRWRNASDDVVVDLSSQPIPSNTNEAVSVWMYSPVDWPPGRYRVELIAPSADLPLIAAGEFEIGASGSVATPFAFHNQTEIFP